MTNIVDINSLLAAAPESKTRLWSQVEGDPEQNYPDVLFQPEAGKDSLYALMQVLVPQSDRLVMDPGLPMDLGKEPDFSAEWLKGMQEFVGKLNTCSRPDFDLYWTSMLPLVAARSTCWRRRVGCILTDVNQKVLATGYNGTPPKKPHCIDLKCEGSDLPSGQGHDSCMAVHAEQNALLQCRNTQEIHTTYVSCSPCMACIKMLAGTSCKRIVFLSEYAHPQSRGYWETSLGLEWVHLFNPIAEAVDVLTKTLFFKYRG